jgi:y4mF family transcriptional regulator
MKCYVYAHINPLTGKVFYIGKGTGQRLNSGDRNKKWRMFVSSLYSEGLSYEQKILHICESEEEAFKLEAAEIIKHLKVGCLLLNNQVPEGNIEKLVQLDIEARKGSTIISSYIKRKRKELKITQPELARKAGVGLRFVREMEQGKKTLRMDKVNQVLQLFGTYLVPYEINRAHNRIY